MSDLLLGLALGTGLIILANLFLVRFTRMSAQQAAAIVILTTLGLYVPYAIVRWPGGDIFAIHLAIYLLTSLACGMLLNARAGGRSLHWGPAVIGGFFVFVVVSGAVFVAVAERGLTSSLWYRLLPEADSQRAVTSVFPGVVSHDFHKKESLYNQYLQQVERQRQRGWQVQKGWLGEPVADQPALFRVAVRTREETPVTGAAVAGQFLRPSTNELDIDFALKETAPGVYESNVTLPAAGRWNLVLSIRKGEELHEIQANTSVLAHPPAQ
ncbi:MAG TPA: FixH family protein [Candidatus Competibacteraceae bacterium]|nr:FixH family protein [Candidatus Competibacteraceae bacterium]HRY17780.1 FixH family protein [Candidatus Competibacteraceae bacterium]